MRRMRSVLIPIIAAPPVIACGGETVEQEKHATQIPNGLAVSGFRGCEDWQTVAVSQAGERVEVILGNRAGIDAYRSCVPGNVTPFPDGARMAKIHWRAERSEEATEPTTIPGTLNNIDFMLKDSKRLTNTSGWGYGQFNDNATSDKLVPLGAGVDCGFACHTLVNSRDYVFMA